MITYGILCPLSPLLFCGDESQAVVMPQGWPDADIIIGEIQVQVNRFLPDCHDEAIKKLKLYALSMNCDAVIFISFSESKDFSTSAQFLAKGTAVQFE